MSTPHDMVLRRPIIGITLGDPAGIGPEIVAKSLVAKEVHTFARPVVVGSARCVADALRAIGSDRRVRNIENTTTLDDDDNAVHCFDVDLPVGAPVTGRVDAACGAAAYAYIERAVSLALAGEIDAICTAPISKEALHAAGHRYPGHTELLAILTGTPEVSMMLTTPNLRVIHVTTHIGLLDAIERIDPPLVERTIRRGDRILRNAGIAKPRIGVCAINPHAGENGLFGRGEEASKIEPGVAACRQSGIDVDGPLPADSLFFRAARGDYDLVVAMYHDQGHGPVKVMGLEAGVNITVGLPIVRTSVDHGTAFDIAGKGMADERSLIAALRAAAELAPQRAGV